ncbi:MAG: hypothetical protein AAGA92_14915 [Planctomycetota bacterium]
MKLHATYRPRTVSAGVLWAGAIVCSMAGLTSATGQVLSSSGDAAPEAEQTMPSSDAVEKAVAKEEKRGGLIKVSWPSIPAPKITFPEFKPPKISFPWSGEDGASFFAPIEAGARKIGEGTKQAWNGFKGIVSPGPKTKSPQARSRPKEPFWQRLFTPKQEPRGPQTVGEWMSQPRLKP